LFTNSRQIWREATAINARSLALIAKKNRGHLTGGQLTGEGHLTVHPETSTKSE